MNRGCPTRAKRGAALVPSTHPVRTALAGVHREGEWDFDKGRACPPGSKSLPAQIAPGKSRRIFSNLAPFPLIEKVLQQQKIFDDSVSTLSIRWELPHARKTRGSPFLCADRFFTAGRLTREAIAHTINLIGGGVFMIYLASDWKDYRVLDSGEGEKLEKWKDVVLRRPDPQAIWPKQAPERWKSADAHYHRSAKGGGEWEFFRKLPERWTVEYKGLKFYVHPTGFKHTGLFPEQAVNWDWMRGLIEGARRPVKVLNLFGYTGGATVAAAKAGAQVTHVDAAKGMVAWAGENRALSGIDEKMTRWIVEDALKFALREARRGNTYQGILMDPPSYGRGPSGEVWKLEDELYGLIDACQKVLSDDALFMLVNSYTTGLQPAVLSNMLLMAVQKGHGGRVEAGEVALPIESGGVLPCGASGRWTGA